MKQNNSYIFLETTLNSHKYCYNLSSSYLIVFWLSLYYTLNNQMHIEKTHSVVIANQVSAKK